MFMYDLPLSYVVASLPKAFLLLIILSVIISINVLKSILILPFSSSNGKSYLLTIVLLLIKLNYKNYHLLVF